MRVGRVTAVDDFPEARKPAWKLTIDFGPEIGVKRSSAQITNYAREELEGRLVVAVVNFPPRQIGPVRSEVLVLGASDEAGHVSCSSPTPMCRSASRIHVSRGRRSTARADARSRHQRAAAAVRGCGRRVGAARAPGPGGVSRPDRRRRLGRRTSAAGVGTARAASGAGVGAGRRRLGGVGGRRRRRPGAGSAAAAGPSRPGSAPRRRRGRRAARPCRPRAARRSAACPRPASAWSWGLGGRRVGRPGSASPSRRRAASRPASRPSSAWPAPSPRPRSRGLGDRLRRRGDRDRLGLRRTGAGGGAAAVWTAVGLRRRAVLDVLDLDGAGGDDRGGGEAGDGLRGQRARARAQRAARGGAGGARRRRRRHPRRPRRPRGGRRAPRGRAATFLSSSSGPTGKTAASARFVWRSCLRKSWQRSHVRRWRRTGGLVRRRPSATSPSSSRTSSQVSSRASAASASDDAGAHEQRLDRRDRGLHRLGDLLVGERVDLAQQQRGALRLGQVLHVRHQLPELLALVHLVGRRQAVLGEMHVHRVDADRLGLAQVVERAVARDPVQPRAHVDLALVGEDRVEGGGEDLLQHVLGVLAAGEHVAAEGQQPRLVAGDQRLEGVRGCRGG